jgi:hypothetical protein
LAVSEADDLAVGRGDDDLALGDGRGGRHGRGGFVFPDFLAAGQIEPLDAAVVGADEYVAAGDRRRRVDAGARGERPERVARLRRGDAVRLLKAGGRCRIRTYDFHRVKVALYR